MEHQLPSMACITPFSITDKETGESIAVPCGQCPECRKRRIAEWSFRLMQEEKHSTSAHFVTLTYGTKYVPMAPSGYLTLNKKHLQNFFKRLRFNTGATNLKYYAVGEYGTDNFRPHYHALIFNLPKEEDVSNAWIFDSRGKETKELLGKPYFGTVTGASVGYTLKYISKKRLIPMHRNDDRVPEFSLMSKGLGRQYLNETSHAWHQNDILNRMHLVTEGGKKLSMPRYYKDKIYTEFEREMIAAYQSPLIEQRQMETIRDKYNGDYYAWSRDETERHKQMISQALKKSKQKKGKL